jgi:hypothetical protein
MTTDEIILAIVATGKFTPPEELKPLGLGKGRSGHRCWELRGDSGTPTYYDSGSRVVYDLCAMHFAREMKSWTDKDKAPVFHRGFTIYMHDGDSAAAIKALYEAVCTMHYERELKSLADKEKAPVFHTGFTIRMHDDDDAVRTKETK